MAINLTGEIRYDTRGLPEGFDPHKLYEYRYETLVKEATGFESFLYKYIPFSVIKSFAIAIDPLAPFKVAPHAITPANRTKWRQTASVLQKRKLVRTNDHQTYAHNPNYLGSSNCWNPQRSYINSSNPTTTLNLGDQEPLADYLKDTTGRTRLFGSKQGTLELFKCYINSPGRNVNYSEESTEIWQAQLPIEPGCAAIGGCNSFQNGGWNRFHDSIQPSAATFSKSTLNARRSLEIAYANSLISKYAIRMLKDYSPGNRDYSLFRNVVELRDLPRSILSLQNTALDFKKLFVSLGTQPKLRDSIFSLGAVAKDLPGEYLSYHFGWKQTFKDLKELLELPNKLSKKINFLIERAGKPTTFRKTLKMESAESNVSGFGYDVSRWEYDASWTSRLEREEELRLVINAVFDFPPLNTPWCKIDYFLDRIGVLPRATDVYNLIPWTWLVDYFTGLGNYVELIDNINHDRSLINWGMITCRINGRIITDFTSKSDRITSTSYNGVQSPIINPRAVNKHTSTLHYECQVRKDVSTVLGVKQTSVPSSLTTYQKSIIGALLAQRADFTRSKAFSPRS